jgi:hypothetical protein
MPNGGIEGTVGANHGLYVKSLHQALFSLNVGFTGTIVLFAYVPNPVLSRLNQMDSSISTLLNVRKTDWATHYFMFFVLALGLALCAWTLFRLFSQTRLAKATLRSVAGFLAIAALPVMAINPPWSNVGTLRKIAFPLEILTVSYLAARYLQGRWPRATWVITVIMIIHFAFWSREFGPYDAIYLLLFRFREFRAFMLFVPDGAPVAWIVALASAIAWAFYVRRSQQIPGLQEHP